MKKLTCTVLAVLWMALLPAGCGTGMAACGSMGSVTVSATANYPVSDARDVSSVFTVKVKNDSELLTLNVTLQMDAEGAVVRLTREADGEQLFEQTLVDSANLEIKVNDVKQGDVLRLAFELDGAVFADIRVSADSKAASIGLPTG